MATAANNTSKTKATAAKAPAKAPAKKAAAKTAAPAKKPANGKTATAAKKPAAKKTAPSVQTFEPMSDADFTNNLNMRRNNTLPESLNAHLDAEIERRKAISAEAVAHSLAPEGHAQPVAPVVVTPDAVEKVTEVIVNQAANAFGAAMQQLAAGALPTSGRRAGEPAGGRRATDRKAAEGAEDTSETQATGNKIEKDRDTQNGVTRPSAGTICDTVWKLAQSMSDKQGSTVEFSKLVEAAQKEGVNMYTARTQYARWRKFNGLTGRIAKPAAPKPAAPKAAPASRKPAAKPIK